MIKWVLLKKIKETAEKSTEYSRKGFEKSTELTTKGLQEAKGVVNKDSLREQIENLKSEGKRLKKYFNQRR